METDIENQIEDLAFDFIAENKRSCTYEELIEYAKERYEEESDVLSKIKELASTDSKFAA